MEAVSRGGGEGVRMRVSVGSCGRARARIHARTQAHADGKLSRERLGVRRRASGQVCQGGGSVRALAAAAAGRGGGGRLLVGTSLNQLLQVLVKICCLILQNLSSNF